MSSSIRNRFIHIIFAILIIIVIITRAEAEQQKDFIITEDLFGDTFSSATFNATDWVCLDSFFSGSQGQEKTILSHCSCFVNFHCATVNIINANPTTPVAATSSLLMANGQSESSTATKTEVAIWFRCYGLQDPGRLNLIAKASPQDLIMFGSRDASVCITNDVLNLRADFVRCNSTYVDEFIRKVEQQEPKRYRLETLMIRDSDLTDVPGWWFEKFTYMKHLNLTANKLTEFDSKLLVPEDVRSNLTSIDLSENYLTHVDLSRFQSLQSINLSQNNLSTLAKSDLPEDVIESLESMRVQHNKTLLDLNIGNNPWNCDDRIEWLIDLISAIVANNGRSYFYETNSNGNGNYAGQLELFQTNEPECDSPAEAKMFPFSVWKSVKESSICAKCNCYLKDKYAKVGYRYVIVNCTGRNLWSLPIRLPKNTKILDLSNNHIRNLSPLTKSHTGQMSRWRYVSKIILSNNSLETLDGLDLIHSIVYLDISGNLLTEIPYHIINKILSSKVDKIRIGNNPYVCDCNTVKMQKWLQNNYRIILDIKQVRCGTARPELAQNESNKAIIEQAQDGKFYGKEILHINSLHLCPMDPTGNLVDFLDILNIILTVSIVLLIVKVIYDYWWQKRTGKLPRFFKLNF